MSANAGPDIGPIPWATIEAALITERHRLDRSASPRAAKTLTLGCAVFWELCDEHINNDRLFQRRLG